MKQTGRLTSNRLRKYRGIMGYEQLEVAFLLGQKSHASISEWENGVSIPTLENLFKLSIIYRTLPDELYYDLRQELIKDIEERREILKSIRARDG